VKVAFTPFKKLKPLFVRRLKDFNSCYFVYCQEMREIVIAFNNIRGAKVYLSEGEICECLCDSVCLNSIDAVSMAGPVICQARHHSFKWSSDLWEKH
jgi:hypothetical protein